MPAPRYRSRTLRRVPVTTPGGTRRLHYTKRKPSKAVCASCKSLLHGVPRERPVVMRTMAKSKKRPERPFGGVLCSRCLRLKFTQKAR
jgi:large subunit ribosomal protein L34e